MQPQFNTKQSVNIINGLLFNFISNEMANGLNYAEDYFKMWFGHATSTNLQIPNSSLNMRTDMLIAIFLQMITFLVLIRSVCNANDCVRSWFDPFEQNEQITSGKQYWTIQTLGHLAVWCCWCQMQHVQVHFESWTELSIHWANYRQRNCFNASWHTDITTFARWLSNWQRNT